METSQNNPDQKGVAMLAIHRVDQGSGVLLDDQLAIEEPLEIRIEHGPRNARVKQSISITMRTPGYDFELAAGFLFTEGIIQEAKQIESIHYCGPDLLTHPFTNIVRVELNPDVRLELGKLSRHFYTTSSCGVCGKSSIEALRTQSKYFSADARLQISSAVIHSLPEILRQSQALFDSTGGLHACALISPTGKLLGLREDVGRHNALDKLIGHSLLQGSLPLTHSILMVSGRASFELIQKATMAGIGIFAAVGAPSSLAVELAKEAGITLLGFVRDGRYNIYSHPDRIDFQKGNA